MSGQCLNCGKNEYDHDFRKDGIYCPYTLKLYTPMTAEQSIEKRITGLEEKIDRQGEQIEAFLAWARDVHNYEPGTVKEGE